MWVYKTTQTIHFLTFNGTLYKICGTGNEPEILSNNSFGVQKRLDEEQRKTLSLTGNFEESYVD